ARTRLAFALDAWAKSKSWCGLKITIWLRPFSSLMNPIYYQTIQIGLFLTMTNNTLTVVPGFRVGHATHLEGGTGCTVVLCPAGTVGGVDQRGGAPGTRETDLLRPTHHVETVNAVLLSGGSAYGLAASVGVM